MSDALIDDLAKDLKPVKPMRTWPMWLGAGIGLVLAAAYVIGFYGLRPELDGGTFTFMAIGKPLLFLLTGVSALWAVSGLVRPEGWLKWRHILPIAAMFVLVTGALMLDLGRSGMAGVSDGLNGGVLLCYMTIVCGGIAGLVVLWRLWLRRAATSHPVTLGAMAGLAVGSLMAAAYSLHCNMDAPVYILAVYGVAVAVVTAAAALIGGKLLRW
ncbi:hypothetical protein ABI_11670 [Asticcacaulis biprosthecium C19]|uniref:DUF1109 domain-containing protein n=1 Tax=Asticcacaulis biprosthecium C19 TaxID=715226 RepID=F4QHJ3_9CAUL|nr:NrsF family protein [Asticcacaulis biprosthecium]EGF92730.1 hypothetical protein ABI_11670 [Asticcacaulis biprosthecium C19]